MFGGPHREDVSPQERLDGLLNPLVVHAGGDDGHQLGERRLRLGNGLFDLKIHNNKTRDEKKKKKKKKTGLRTLTGAGIARPPCLCIVRAGSETTSLYTNLERFSIPKEAE